MIFEIFWSFIFYPTTASDNSTRIKRVLPFQMMGGWVSASSYVCKVSAASAVCVDPLMCHFNLFNIKYLYTGSANKQAALLLLI